MLHYAYVVSFTSVRPPPNCEAVVTILGDVTVWRTVLLQKLIGSAASQEIPRILRKPEVHYCLNEGAPLSPCPEPD